MAPFGSTGEPGVLRWGPHHQAVVAGGSGGVEGGPVRAHRRAWSPAVGTLPPGSGSVGGVAPFTDACSEMAIPSRQLPALTPTYGPRPKGTTNLVPSGGHSNPGLCPCLHHVPDGTMPMLAYFSHLPPALLPFHHPAAPTHVPHPICSLRAPKHCTSLLCLATASTCHAVPWPHPLLCTHTHHVPEHSLPSPGTSPPQSHPTPLVSTHI